MKLRVPSDEAEVPSVTNEWPTADHQEREIFDMFGVVFDGHPDLRGSSMRPSDYEGHRSAAIFPVGGEPVLFTYRTRPRRTPVHRLMATEIRNLDRTPTTLEPTEPDRDRRGVLGPEEELLTLNMGPHHPATHGVLRLLTTLEGEVVQDVKPIVGYVHTGIEKTAEDKSYWKVIPVVERMDYLSYYFNAMAYCGAVETLLGIEVPKRAQYLRVIHLELNRIASHLIFIATGCLDLGAVSMFWYGWRERDMILDLFEQTSGQRMHTRYFQVGGVMEDVPSGWEANLRRFIKTMPERNGQYRALLSKNEIALSRLQGRVPARGSPSCSRTASPARCCARRATRGTCARRCRTRPTTTSSSRSRSAPWATTGTASPCASRRSTSPSGSSSRRSTASPRGRT